MKYQYIDLSNQKDLIKDVIIRKLTIQKDASGTLFETLRKDWADVINETDLQFAMQYMSITPPGVARDEDKWHVHQFQKDRFICASGRIVTAIYDPRGDSQTRDKLNLFLMGPEKENEMYMVVIPQNTYHGFMTVSRGPGHLLNFPTQLYNRQDEGRVSHGGEFNWRQVRSDLGIRDK